LDGFLLIIFYGFHEALAKTI